MVQVGLMFRKEQGPATSPAWLERLEKGGFTVVTDRTAKRVTDVFAERELSWLAEAPASSDQAKSLATWLSERLEEIESSAPLPEPPTPSGA
ncbi:MAG: hypothetical protein ACLP0J_24180 [Solirubrobacteraceae bacterium]|jgi:hypothetical protein